MAPFPPTKPTRKPTPTLLSPTASSSLGPPSKIAPHSLHKSSTKRQKRVSKHATLLSRIAKTAAPRSKAPKRRRPSKKLVASLDSLADALPGLTDHAAAGDDDDAWEGSNIDDDDDDDRNEGAKIKHKTLKSRPGAGKKKEKLVAMERERFAKNLAEMSAGSASSQNVTADGRMMIVEEGEGAGGAKGGGSAERWAAIRGFIGQTMERRRPDGEAVLGGRKK